MIPNVASIAGLDPSGGAGVLADVKTISALGCYGMAVVAALTAQNTRRVVAVRAVAPDFVVAQIDAIFEDVRVDAVKIGMLGTAAVATAIADRLGALRPRFIVLDPVIAASSGDALATDETIDVLRRRLIPLATLVTPNLDEAAVLSGSSTPIASEAEIERAALRLLSQGAAAVLIKGGHGAGPNSNDYLFECQSRRVFSAPRIDTTRTHGTGCALSSAIACGLARGLSLQASIEEAKRYLSGALGGVRLSVGGGRGPIDHFWRFS